MQKKFKKGKQSRKALYFIIASLFIFHIYNLTSFNAAAAPMRTDISVHVANDMINNNTGYPDLLILDVREVGEYNSHHLYNATLIPLGTIESRLDEITSYNDTEIIVYCRSGVRSLQGSNILVANNFSKVFNMLGGIDTWIAAGYDYWTNEDPTTTIDSALPMFLVSIIGIISVVVLISIRKQKVRRAY
ncbi:MAG: rhodanese-like domain-containing protein [Promethearchaeota archaeon]|jgi:rhodanese-related sulfurtransferase